MTVKDFGITKEGIATKLYTLKNNNLDYQTIMEKPIESQKLFLELLLKAEKEVGFYTEGYKLLVEAFSSPDGLFVFTITKYIEKPTTPSNKPKVTPKKKIKNVNPKSNTSIYKFSSFEEFCEFCTAMHHIPNFQSKQLAKTIAFYLFNDTLQKKCSNIIHPDIHITHFQQSSKINCHYIIRKYRIYQSTNIILFVTSNKQFPLQHHIENLFCLP